MKLTTNQWFNVFQILFHRSSVISQHTDRYIEGSEIFCCVLNIHVFAILGHLSYVGLSLFTFWPPTVTSNICWALILHFDLQQLQAIFAIKWFVICSVSTWYRIFIYGDEVPIVPSHTQILLIMKGRNYYHDDVNICFLIIKEQETNKNVGRRFWKKRKNG